ncbi:MAG: DegT/DnrJ/EryC1/StrS family aminotransferase [Firmicutes bacterium]|nr:DegT/DnrJ/EryC1/StrS family aminotransferase [Bacillota bacterium]
MTAIRCGAVCCRPHFTPIYLQPFYRAQFGFKEGDFPATELARRASIAIPFHNHLTAEEIDYVAGVLERALGEVR